MRFREILVLTPADCELVTTQLGALERVGARVESIRFVPLLRELGLAGAMERIAKAAEGKDAVFANLLGDNFQFPVSFFLRLRESAPLVLWFYDDEMYFDAHSKHYAQAAHAVVTTDLFSVAAYERMGVPAELCWTLVSREKRAPAAVDRDIDVSFVGDCLKADRARFLARLEREGIEIQTWGRGSKNGRADEAKVSELFSRSKISLNFSKLDELSWLNSDEPVLGRVRGHKGRPIEIAMAGGFCLSEWYPALPSLLEPGAEIDVFTDEDSLVAKVREHLKHPQKREKMAENAHRRALKEYESVPALRALLERLAERLDSPPPAPPTAHEGPRYLRLRANVLFLHMLGALRRLRPLQAVEWAGAWLACGPRAALLGGAGGLARALRIASGKGA